MCSAQAPNIATYRHPFIRPRRRRRCATVFPSFNHRSPPSSSQPASPLQATAGPGRQRPRPQIDLIRPATRLAAALPRWPSSSTSARRLDTGGRQLSSARQSAQRTRDKRGPKRKTKGVCKGKGGGDWERPGPGAVHHTTTTTAYRPRLDWTFFSPPFAGVAVVGDLTTPLAAHLAASPPLRFPFQRRFPFHPRRSSSPFPRLPFRPRLDAAAAADRGNVAITDAIVKLPGWTDATVSSHYGQPTICSSSISTSRTSS